MSDPYLNDVTLVGRLAEQAVRRALPMGGRVVSWRLIVDRPRAEGARRVVDTFPCATFDEAVGGAAVEWEPGDLIEVHGSMRRRFWRSRESPASRIEVEVYEAAVLAVAPPVRVRPGRATA